MRGLGAHQQDAVLWLERAFHHPHQHDDAHIVIEPGIDDQRPQRRGRIALRRGHAGDDRFQDVGDVLAGLRARADRIARGDTDHVLDLLDRLRRVGGGEVDLVQHRNHFHALLDGGVAVRHRLRLDALRGVHHQHGAFARGERAADLVGEVDVARCIDQVEEVLLAILSAILERRGLRLDGDATLALELHRVEHLLGHLAPGKPAAHLDEAIGERRLAMVDVRDDGKVADMG